MKRITKNSASKYWLKSWMVNSTALLLASAIVACSSAKKQADSPTDTQAASAAVATAAASNTTPATPKSDSATASKDAPVAPDEAQLLCTKGNEKRTLEVVTKDKGCTLNYSKNGSEKEVASASVGTEHCENSKEKIRTKLEKAGYECR